MNKKELEKFEEMLLEEARKLEKIKGKAAKNRAKYYKPASLAIRMLQTYMLAINEDPIKVECEKRNGRIGFKATFKDGKVKFFTS